MLYAIIQWRGMTSTARAKGGCRDIPSKKEAGDGFISTLRLPVSDPINWPSEITPQKPRGTNFFGFTMAGTYLKHTGILWGGGITGEFSEL